VNVALSVLAGTLAAAFLTAGFLKLTRRKDDLQGGDASAPMPSENLPTTICRVRSRACAHSW
jgi:membrane glycosyltransferase